MNRRVLVIEPDATIRRMLEYALSAAGFAPTSTPTVEASRALLDGTPMDAAVLEMRATNSEGTDGVRTLRADYPELPLVVTGTLLTPRVMQELIRTRVDDVVPKPFTPREIVSAVERVLQSSRTRHDGALEYAAAMANARRAVVEGRLRDAEAPLARARAVSPLDGEAMALWGMVAELSGHDHDADRAYRAALALQEERVTEDILPGEGLARLRAYAGVGARAVPTFDHHGKKSLWFVSNAVNELALGPVGDKKPDVVVFTLGLIASETSALYARIAADKQAFLIATSAMTERLVLRVTHSFEQPQVLAHPETLTRMATNPQSLAPDSAETERTR
jgi:DNA-binding NarL/FixJ family response regulator